MSNVERTHPINAAKSLTGPAECEGLWVTLAANGAVIRRDGNSSDRYFGVDGIVVFNDPGEFGEWFERWLRGKLGK